MAETYERYLVPALFAPYAADLASRVAASRPDTILELAAGTGVLTHRLGRACHGARVTATDLNPAMVDYASARVTTATWQQADATDLPFEADSFDVVVCQFGVMFFPDKQQAFREVARVLKPGGRFVCNIWDVIERNDLPPRWRRGWRRPSQTTLRRSSAVFPTDTPTPSEWRPTWRVGGCVWTSG